MKKKVPRVMIAASGSNCGKTTVMLALLGVLKNRNLTVQSYKSGPDYIDPMFHSFVTGRKTYHTDAFFSDSDSLNDILSGHSDGADISVIEGAMGYYDGTGKSSDASAYSVSYSTETPVILVVNPNGMGVSCAAIVKGYMNFREKSNIKGVILNRIRPGMYSYYRDIIENETGVSVCGYLPEMDGINLESRHLGLVTAGEISNLSEITGILQKTAGETLDTDLILRIASDAPDMICKEKEEKPENKYIIGVASDDAFCFYYDENLEMLENSGAEIKYFSPLKDERLPDDVSGLYFGGGYPELHLKELSGNTSFLEDLRRKAGTGIPVFAECGGFMYLQKGIYDKDGNYYETAGLLDGTSKQGSRLCRFGYITVTAKQDCVIAEKGMSFKAHEFHYSDSTGNGDAFTAVKPDGRKWDAVVVKDNITAGFPHFYFPSNPEIVRVFSEKCEKYKSGTESVK